MTEQETKEREIQLTLWDLEDDLDRMGIEQPKLCKVNDESCEACQ